MEICKYQMDVPYQYMSYHGYLEGSTTGSAFSHGTAVMCGAYSVSKRPDGLHWAHYPLCVEHNCPLIHPELLEGATLT